MNTAGIVVDNWKLGIFRRHLTTAKLQYTTSRFADDSTLIKVSCLSIVAVHAVCLSANTECAKVGAPIKPTLRKAK